MIMEEIMKIGIIGAMDIEVAALKDIMADAEIKTISTVDFYSGTINGAEVIAAVAGVGKVNAAVTAQTMILTYKPDYIINIGVAGGLRADFKIGDIAVAESVVEHDMDTTAIGDPIGLISGLDTVNIKCDERLSKIMLEAANSVDGIKAVSGVIASGDQFISTNEARKKIIDNFGAIAAEMEGASVGHVCAMNNVKFGVMRAISDGANDDSHMDYPTFAKIAAANSVKIAVKVIGDLNNGKN